MLQRQDIKLNVKKLYRLYKEERLAEARCPSLFEIALLIFLVVGIILTDRLG